MSSATTKTKALAPSTGPMSTGTAVVSADHIDELAAQYSLGKLDITKRFANALMMAEGINRLTEAMTPHMATVLSLMNKPLGFKTDRPSSQHPAPYPMELVRDCAIEALLKGLCLHGNEWNIIAGQCYVTKNGLTRLIKQHPGVTDFKVQLGVPRFSGDKGAVVACEATWNMDGKAQSVKREIPVRVNSAMGADAILGKAERKIKYAAYCQITGSETSDEDVGETIEAMGTIVASPTTTPDGESKTQALGNRLNGSGKSPTPSAKPMSSPITPEQLETLDEFRKQLGLKHAECLKLLEPFGVKEAASLNVDQAGELIERLKLEVESLAGQ